MLLLFVIIVIHVYNCCYCCYDRYFLLIESSAMNQGSADIGRIINHAKRDPTELLMGAGITGSIHSILTHCSPEIFKVYPLMIVGYMYMRMKTMNCHITLLIYHSMYI